MTDKNKDDVSKEELKTKIEKLKKDLEECEKEKQKYLEGWQRTKADLINYKKDEDSRFKTVKERSNKALMKDLLSVLDSFDLGLSSQGENSSDKKGMEMINNQLKNALKKHGLEKINVSVGDEFNPEIHEAVARVDSEDSSDEIVEITEAGYKLNDKILRPAKVKVSKGH